jgi:protein-tyrosine phosphatase
MAPLTGNPLPPPRDTSVPYTVCFVCLGNICRSPMAEAVLRAKVAEAGLGGRVAVDSAGTGDWHVGQPMNPPARSQLASHGYAGETHRARQFRRSWLAERDLILAMDASNLAVLRRFAGPDPEHRVRLFGEVAGLGGADVPDPYGGDRAEFGRVLDLLETGMANLTGQLRTLLQAPVADR